MLDTGLVLTGCKPSMLIKIISAYTDQPACAPYGENLDHFYGRNWRGWWGPWWWAWVVIVFLIMLALGAGNRRQRHTYYRGSGESVEITNTGFAWAWLIVVFNLLLIFFRGGR